MSGVEVVACQERGFSSAPPTPLPRDEAFGCGVEDPTSRRRIIEILSRRRMPAGDLPQAYVVAACECSDKTPITLNAQKGDEEARSMKRLEMVFRQAKAPLTRFGDELMRHKQSLLRERVRQFKKVVGRSHLRSTLGGDRRAACRRSFVARRIRFTLADWNLGEPRVRCGGVVPKPRRPTLDIVSVDLVQDIGDWPFALMQPPQRAARVKTPTLDRHD